MLEMQEQILVCIKKLDNLAIDILNNHFHIDPQCLRNLIYSTFSNIISQEKCIDHSFQAEIHQILQQRTSAICIENLGEIRRGRPLKNMEAQNKLAEWIQGQKREYFTKKQIDRKFKALSKTKRSLSYTSLSRILSINGIDNKIKIVKNRSLIPPSISIGQKVVKNQCKEQCYFDDSSNDELFRDNCTKNNEISLVMTPERGESNFMIEDYFIWNSKESEFFNFSSEEAR